MHVGFTCEQLPNGLSVADGYRVTDQNQKAIRAAENISFPGIKNVWTRPIKMQLEEGYKHIIVMEFESEEALKDYADSPAQKKWYEVYIPIREESRAHDIAN